MARAFRSGFNGQRSPVCPIAADPNLNAPFSRRSGRARHDRAMRRRFILGALATVLGAISPLPAAGQRRRRGRNRGAGRRRDALPPAAVMDSVARRLSGKVLGADRARRGGRAIYRLKVLTERGDVLDVEADAATGEILSVRGRGR